MDKNNPEHRRMEARNIALSIVRRKLVELENEVDFLINATPTGERRNLLTDINIKLMDLHINVKALKNEDYNSIPG